MYRALLLLIALLPSLVFAQNGQVVRVGVATLDNQSGRGVPVDVERDRLVRALNQIKPDKKTHLKLEAIPLEGTSGNELSDRAAQKNCDYILYTTLTELRQAGDPYQHRPGTIETNPNGQWSSQNPSAQAMDPEYRATAEYRLYNIKAHTTITGPPYSTQQATNEMDTVSQLLDRVASNVFSEIKKGGTPGPMRE